MIFEKNIRVLHFTAMWPTHEFPHSGTFVKNLVNGLRKRGGVHEVLFIPVYKSKWEYVKAFKILKDVLKAKKYHLVHSQYAHCNLIAGLVSRIPVVGHFHGEFGYGNYINEYYKDSLIAKFASKIIKASIVVNPWDIKHVCSKYKAVIPIGVDPDFFYPMDRVKACKALGWDPKPLKVLFPSDPKRPEKNYGLFKKVLNKLKKEFCDLKEVILHRVPYEKVPLYMNAVDLMILSSKTEASPTVIKEALACNLPIISTPVGDTLECLKGVRNSAVVRPEGIYEVARDILKKRTRSNGRIKISHYSLEITINKVLRFYQKILE